MKRNILKWALLWAVLLAVWACFGMSALATSDESPLGLTIRLEDDGPLAESVETFQSFTMGFNLPEDTTAARIVLLDQDGGEKDIWPFSEYDEWGSWQEDGRVEWRDWIDESGNWTLRAQVYTGALPEDFEQINWNDATHVKSQDYPLEVTAVGTAPAACADVFEEHYEFGTLTRGDMIWVTLSGYEDLYITNQDDEQVRVVPTQWFFYIEDSNGERVGGGWYEEDIANEEGTFAGQRFAVSTARVLAGTGYRLVIKTGLQGYDWGVSESEPFTIVGNEAPITLSLGLNEEGDAYYTRADWEFPVGVYAPGASRIELIRVDAEDINDPDCYETICDSEGEDSALWGVNLDESGEYALFARAYYPAGENGQAVEPVESDYVIVRVESNGRLDPCDITISSLMPISVEPPLYFLVDGLDQTTKWEEPLEDYWWEITVHDEDMDGETLEARDGDDVVWRLTNDDGPIPRYGYFTAPTLDDNGNPLFVAGHRHRLEVWVDARGMDGARSDREFWFYNPDDIESGEVTLGFQENREPSFDDDYHAYEISALEPVYLRASAPASEGSHGPATMFLLFDGCDWRPVGPADEKGVFEWVERPDLENTSYAVMACYQDLSDFYEDGEFDWGRFEDVWRNGEDGIEFVGMSNIVDFYLTTPNGAAPHPYADVFWTPEDQEDWQWPTNPVANNIMRGELLNVTLYGYETKYHEYQTDDDDNPILDEDGNMIPIEESGLIVPCRWRAYIENANGEQVGDVWDEGELSLEALDGYRFSLPTGDIEAGDDYRVVIETGAEGCSWTRRESVQFSIYDNEDPVTLSIDLEYIETDDEAYYAAFADNHFNAGVYAPGAEYIELIQVEAQDADDPDCYKVVGCDGESNMWDVNLDESGDYVLFVRAFYPAGEDEEAETAESEYKLVRVESNGRLDPCDITISSLMPISVEPPLHFLVDGLDQTTKWEEPLEDYWWEITVHDEDMDGETLEARDGDDVVWRLTNDDGPIPRYGYFTAPTLDDNGNPLFVAGHRHRIEVWVDAVGMDGAQSDREFWFFNADDINGEISLDFQEDHELYCDSDYHSYEIGALEPVYLRASAPASEGSHGPATMFLLFDGCDWRPVGPADEKGVFEWVERPDLENTSYAVMACYQDLSDFYEDGEFDWGRFEDVWRNGEDGIEFVGMSYSLDFRVTTPYDEAPGAFADVLGHDYQFGENGAITRGELVNVTLYGYETKYHDYLRDEQYNLILDDDGNMIPDEESGLIVPCRWRAYIENANGEQVGDVWDEGELSLEALDGYRFSLPTGDVRAGSGYRVVIETGAEGCSWTRRESVQFSIVNPNAENPIVLSLSTNELLEGQNLEYAAYAPDGLSMSIYWRNKLNPEGEIDYDEWCSGNYISGSIGGEFAPGEYEIYAFTSYPDRVEIEYDEDNPDEPYEKHYSVDYATDWMTVTIHREGILENPVVEGIPSIMYDGQDEPLSFRVLPVPEAQSYEVELRWQGVNGDDADESLWHAEFSGEDFTVEETEDGEVWYCPVEIPRGAFVGVGIYRVDVTAKAIGYYGSSIENRFLLAPSPDPEGPGCDVTLKVATDGEDGPAFEPLEEISVRAFEAVHLSVDSPAAKAVRVYNGDGWDEFWRDGDGSQPIHAEFDWDFGQGYYSLFAMGLYDFEDTDENGDPILDEDGNPQTHDEWIGYSNGLRVHAFVEDLLDEPELQVDGAVTRGDYLNVNIGAVEGAEWYDLHIYAMYYAHSEPDGLFEMHGLHAGNVSVPTARLEPGYYYICGYAKAVGKESRPVDFFRRYGFEVMSPNEEAMPEDGVYFSVSNPAPRTCERLTASAYVPDAVMLRVYAGHDSGEEWGIWGGDAFETTGWWFGEPGPHTLTLQALTGNPDEDEDFDWNAWHDVRTIDVNVCASYDFKPSYFEIPDFIEYGNPLVLHPGINQEGDTVEGITQVHLRVQGPGYDVFDGYGTSFEVPADSFNENTLYRVEMEVYGYNYNPLYVRRNMLVAQEENISSDIVFIQASDKNPMINQDITFNAGVDSEEFNVLRVCVDDQCWNYMSRDAANIRWRFPNEGCYTAYAQAGRVTREGVDPETIDWDSWNWKEWDWDRDVEWGPISNLMFIETQQPGETAQPHIALTDGSTVLKGDYLRVDIVGPQAQNAMYYDLHIRDNNDRDVCYEDGNEIYSARYYARDDVDTWEEGKLIHTFLVPTLDYEPGSYHAVVTAGGRTGCLWCDSEWNDGAFEILPPVGEPEPIFTLSRQAVQVNDEFNVTIYAPGAVGLRLICDIGEDVDPGSDDVDCWTIMDGERFCGNHWFDSGYVYDNKDTIHSFTAWGLYPVDVDGEEVEWRQVGEARAITVHPVDDDHRLSAPDIQLSKSVYYPGDTVEFTIPSVPHAVDYHVWVENMNGGWRVYDENLDRDAFWAYYLWDDNTSSRYPELHVTLPAYFFNGGECWMVGCEASTGEPGYEGSWSQKSFFILPEDGTGKHDNGIDLYVYTDEEDEGVPITPINKSVRVRVEANGATEAHVYCGNDNWLDPVEDEKGVFEGVFEGSFELWQEGTYPLTAVVYGENGMRWYGPCPLKAYAYGITDLPSLEAPKAVVQGEFLPLTVGESWNAEWYEIWVKDAEGRDVYSRSIHSDYPGVIPVPTVTLEPGKYMIQVDVGGRPGFYSASTDMKDCRFNVLPREDEEDTAYFRLSKTELEIYEPFTVAIHVPTDEEEEESAVTWRLLCDSEVMYDCEGFNDGLPDSSNPYFDENAVPEEEESATHVLSVEVITYEEGENADDWRPVWTPIGEPVEVTVTRRGWLEPAPIELDEDMVIGIDGEEIEVTIYPVDNADHYHVEVNYAHQDMDPEQYFCGDYSRRDFDENDGIVRFSFFPDYSGTFTVSCSADANKGFVPSYSERAIPVYGEELRPANADHPIEVTLNKNTALMFDLVTLDAHAEGAKYLRFMTPENVQRDNEPDWDDEKPSRLNEDLHAEFNANRPGHYPILVEAVYDTEYGEMHYYSALQYLDVIQLGVTGMPGLEVPGAVARGEFLNISIGEAEFASHYDVYVYPEDSEEQCYHAGYNSFGAFDLPTVFLEEGDYRIWVCAGGRLGYDWKDSEVRSFHVDEPEEGPGDVWFHVNRTELLVNEPLAFCAYASGATQVTIEIDEEGRNDPTEGETYISCGNEHLSFNWPGTHTVAAYYTTAEEPGDEDWILINSYDISWVEGEWGMYEPDVWPEPAVVVQGESFSVGARPVEHGVGYNLSAFRVGTDWQVLDCDMNASQAVDGVLTFEDINTSDWGIGRYDLNLWVNSNDPGYTPRMGRCQVDIVARPSDDNPVVTLTVPDIDDLWSNVAFDVQVDAPGATALCLYLGEGQVHYRTGDSFDEPFSLNGEGTHIAYVKACYDEEGIDYQAIYEDRWSWSDWEGLNWTATSDIVEMNIQSHGQMHQPATLQVPATVTRGELLPVTVGDDDTEEVIQWFDLHLCDNDWNQYAYQRLEQSGTGYLPTVDLAPGEYFVNVSTCAEGYMWNDTGSERGRFRVVEPASEDIQFYVTPTTLTLGDEIIVSIYAPGADEAMMVVESDEEEDFHQEWGTDSGCYFTNSEWWAMGTFTLTAKARYGEDEWVTANQTYTLTANPIGTLTFPDQTWSRVVYQGDPITVDFSAAPNAQRYLVGIINPDDLGNDGPPWRIQYYVEPGQQTIDGSDDLGAGVTYIVGVDPEADGWVLPDWDPTHRVAVVNPDMVLTLPAAMTTIDEEAFTGVGAQMIVLPSGVTSIGSRAFANCPNLVAVINPSGASIPEDAFDDCVHEVVVADHIGF